MKAKILKVFGFAALMALGVQTANAAVTRYYGWIACEAVGDGLVAASGTSYPTESKYSKKSVGGQTKEYASEPGVIIWETKYGTWTYVSVSPTVDGVAFQGFFTDAGCTAPFSSENYSFVEQWKSGSIIGDVYKVYIPSSSAAGTSAPAEEFQTKIYAKFAKPVTVQTVATSAELATAIEGGNTSIKIESGATLTIAKGEKVTIPSGTTLTVDGTLEILGGIDNKGKIDGAGLLTGSFCAVQQEPTVQIPYPYGTDSVTAGKYVKTTSQSLNIGAVDAGVSQKWSVTVTTGSGTELKSGLLEGVPAAVVCTVDKTTALNYITDIAGIYADVPSAIEAAKYAENYQDNDQLVVLVKDTPALYDSPAYQSPNALRKGFAIDCAGNTAYFYGNQFGSKYLIRFFNGPVTLWSKLMRTHVNFYGCSKVSVLSVAVKYNTEVSLYDIAVSHNTEGASNVQIGYLEETGDEELLDDEASYVRYFGGGIYDAFPKSITPEEHLKAYVTPVVYWGTFVEDPTEYLADKEKFEGKLQEGGEYLVVEKSAEVEVEIPEEIEARDETGAPITDKDAAEKAVEVAETAVQEIAGNKSAEMAGTGVGEAIVEKNSASGEQEVKPSIVSALESQVDEAEELTENQKVDVKAKVSESKDVSSYVNVKVESPLIKVETVQEQKVVTVQALVYDVKPMAVTKVTTTVETEEPKTVTVEVPIENKEIAKPITFRLPITENFAMSAKVKHESDDKNYEVEEFVCPVKGLAGGRYVEITTTHFSTFILSPYNAVVTESGETLGIVKVAKTAGGETVVGVPFEKFDVASGTAKATTVDQLLVAGFGADDDIYAYNPDRPSGDEYDMWAWDGEKWGTVPGSTQPPAAESAEMASGKALWFKDESDSATALTLAGLYRENVTTTVDVGKKSLLVNPYPMAINAAEKLKEGACVGDQFALVGGTDRYEFRDGAWGVIAKGEVVKTLASGVKIYGPDMFVAKDVIEIPAGQAFWYISTGATAPTVKW